MRARTLRLGILAGTAFLLYLFGAYVLASTGVANLPLSFGTTDAFRGFVIRITLLALTFLGVLATGVLKKRQRRERAQLLPNPN